MKKNPLSKGMIEENSAGIGEISGEMVWARSKELALIAGKPMTNEHYGQALRELTGGSAMDAKQALLESATEDERWNPVLGSVGYQADIRRKNQPARTKTRTGAAKAPSYSGKALSKPSMTRCEWGVTLPNGIAKVGIHPIAK